MASTDYAVPSVPSLGPQAGLDEIAEFCRTIGQWIQAREPSEKGGDLDKVLTWRDAVNTGLVVYERASSGGGKASFTPVVIPSGPQLGGLDDLTPPDPITGLTVTSLPTAFFIEFDPPIYTQGGGNLYSIIYAANYSGSGPLPTFSQAQEIGRVTARSTIIVLPAQPGQRTHFWAQPVSAAENAADIAPQASPTGGTNGVWSICGQLDGATAIAAATIGTAQIVDLAVTSAKIANLSVSKLTAGAIAAGEYMQSTGFVSGSYGYRLSGDGTAEFNNIIARGTIYANAAHIQGQLIASQISTVDADTITSGSINGINVNAASHTTKGSYLTTASLNGAGTLNVKNTADFPASGKAFILDTLNDRNVVTYTGKTATTLTGCTGVLGHLVKATIVPAIKTIAIDSKTNEMRFYGNRGDGNFEELASVGIMTDNSDAVGVFGSQSYLGMGVLAQTKSSTAPALSAVAYGSGRAAQAIAQGTGNALYASSVTGTAVSINSTSGGGIDISSPGGPPIRVRESHYAFIQAKPLAALPYMTLEGGDVAMVFTTGGSAGSRTGTPRLIYSDGSVWRFVSDNTTFSG